MKCPFCEDTKILPFKGTKLYVCGGCGLFINTPMTPNQVRETNKNFLLSTCNDVPPGKRRLAAAQTEQLDIIERYMKPGRVYDVGAASGFFMKAAMDAGWRADGNEISMKAVEWAKDYFDMDIDCGLLEDLDLPENHYDLVVMWNTLEHTINPKQTLDICKKMLKPGGYVFIKVPEKTTVSELNKFYERVHLFEFTYDVLSKHLKDMGFEEVYKELDTKGSKIGVRAMVYLYRKV